MVSSRPVCPAKESPPTGGYSFALVDENPLASANRFGNDPPLGGEFFVTLRATTSQPRRFGTVLPAKAIPASLG